MNRYVFVHLKILVFDISVYAYLDNEYTLKENIDNILKQYDYELEKFDIYETISKNWLNENIKLSDLKLFNGARLIIY